MKPRTIKSSLLSLLLITITCSGMEKNNPLPIYPINYCRIATNIEEVVFGIYNVSSHKMLETETDYAWCDVRKKHYIMHTAKPWRMFDTETGTSCLLTITIPKYMQQSVAIGTHHFKGNNPTKNDYLFEIFLLNNQIQFRLNKADLKVVTLPKPVIFLGNAIETVAQDKIKQITLHSINIPSIKLSYFLNDNVNNIVNEELLMRDYRTIATNNIITLILDQCMTEKCILRIDNITVINNDTVYIALDPDYMLYIYSTLLKKFLVKGLPMKDTTYQTMFF